MAEKKLSTKITGLKVRILDRFRAELSVSSTVLC